MAARFAALTCILMRLAVIALLAPVTLTAQTLVSTTPGNRTGILEEFTAVNCPICPQGHTIAANLLAANPADFIVVGVHGGGLSVPSGNQPDFRTSWGTSLWSHFGVNAQPLGMMNRTPFNGQLILGRSVWSNALNATLATPAPVNIGAATQFDEGTRTLTVDVEVYYTATGGGGNDHLSVLLTESDIIGFQASGGTNYAHQHVLRSFLSPLWGDELMNNTAGALEQRSYTFTVPTNWNINNCDVVAFVGEFQGEVHNAVEVGANNMATGLQDDADMTALLVYPQPATDRLHVAFNSTEPIAYTISDLHGRVVVAANVTQAGSAVGIDVSALPEGIYILRSQDHAQRFVVAR
jgi:hypothetical protein